jgi:hypothetical protein
MAPGSLEEDQARADPQNESAKSIITRVIVSPISGATYLSGTGESAAEIQGKLSAPTSSVRNGVLFSKPLWTDDLRDIIGAAVKHGARAQACSKSSGCS